MSRSPARILFVDDDATNLYSMGWLIREAGYHVLEASTGAQALALAQQGIDLLILDVNLPDLDGFEVCRQLRDQAETKFLPILQISAVFVGSGDRSQGLEAGADAYLVKPVEPRELLATVRALLRMHEAEETARSIAREWRTTFDAISDIVCLLDDAGNITRCNRALTVLTGNPFSAIIGRSLEEVLGEALGLESRPRMVHPGAVLKFESQEICLGARWFSVTINPIRDGQQPIGPEGNASRAVYVLTEVTHRKELEDQLRKAQRLESIGRLAGGMAHDFNNLLTVILGNASLLLDSLPGEDPDHNLVATIERTASRAADLIRQLLGFSRQSLLWVEPIAPGPLLDAFADRIRPELPDTIQLEVLCSPESWEIHGDRRQIENLLHNLYRNAVDAMPQGGKLLLEVRNETVGDGHAAHHLEARPGDFVRFRVADSGTGIMPEIRDKIFEPFFTTKGVGKGSGLGLAMAHGTAKQHQGWVEFHSRPGVGSEFDLYLPRSTGAAQVASPVHAMVAASTGSRLILLAEDDQPLRTLAAAYLRQGGFRVLLAADGQEALDLFHLHRNTIDLVILDLRMPTVSGRAVLQQMRECRPELPALLAATSPADATGDAQTGIVGKPYRERELLQAVQALLRV